MKIIKSEEVAKLIKDNDTVAISGSGGSGSPESLLKSVMDYYNKNKTPKNITVVTGISPGNLTTDYIGMNMLSKKGLVGKAICAHLGMGKLFGAAVGENNFPAFALPLGVLNHLLRAIAGHEPGIITHIGLDTFADPRIEGCCANDLAKKEKPIVELMKIDNEEYLFYKSFPINVALLKGTYADNEGNISFEHEGVLGEQFNMASATHNSGGIVIVEVKEIKPSGSLKAKDVLVNKHLVDYVVIAQPDASLGEYNLPIYRPELTGAKKLPLKKVTIKKLDERKVCARRAAMELKKNTVINLGIGMPDMVANVALEEGFLDSLTLSIETGALGGMPIGGIAFGASINPESIIPTAENFDLYNGGFLDMAILGLAEVDKEGNVNVSSFGPRKTGPGGFINITQSTKKIIFMGTFTNGSEEVITNNSLNILKEGPKDKFVSHVEQITFSGKNALKNNQEILYITERAVFKLTKKGLELIEIAPGINLEQDILSHMSFKPIISSNLKEMDTRIFCEEKMNLKI